MVAQYQHLLLKLVVRKTKLADETVATRNILAADGQRSYKLLTLLRLLD